MRNSAGLLGPGLDVRGIGGYVIVPSPGSGYEWDPVCNLDTTGLAPAPEWLWPPRPSRAGSAKPIRPVRGLSPYAEKALEAACHAIVNATAGEQERTLNAECFSIGTLAGAGAIPADIALQTLLRAASTMPDYDTRRPWRPEEDRPQGPACLQRRPGQAKGGAPCRGLMEMRRKPQGGEYRQSQSDPGARPRRFLPVRFRDIGLTAERPYLVKGLLPREGLVVIWGPPKCGKSFWTFDIVHARRARLGISRPSRSSRQRGLCRLRRRARHRRPHRSVPA